MQTGCFVFLFHFYFYSREEFCATVYILHHARAERSSNSSNSNANAVIENPLNTEALEPLLKGIERLLTSGSGRGTEDELGAELPICVDLPLSGDLLVDKGVVVLEVAAESLGLEGGPQHELVHAVAVGGPGWEAVGVDGELVLHGLYGGAGDEEEDLMKQKLSV